MVLLKWGDRGPQVVAVQILVNRHTPSIVLAVDGIFGPKTHNGVVACQRHQRLKVDGIVGPQTWGRLMQLF